MSRLCEVQIIDDPYVRLSEASAPAPGSDDKCALRVSHAIVRPRTAGRSRARVTMPTHYGGFVLSPNPVILMFIVSILYNRTKGPSVILSYVGT